MLFVLLPIAFVPAARLISEDTPAVLHPVVPVSLVLVAIHPCVGTFAVPLGVDEFSLVFVTVRPDKAPLPLSSIVLP